MEKELIVIYRACGKEIDSNYNVCRPNYFDKLKCWKSFYDSFGKKCNIYVVFDGNTNNKLYEYIQKFKIEQLYKLDGVGNEKSLLYCYDLAEKLNNWKYVYFLEDDYLHLPNSYEILIDGLISFGKFGPITLYDHLDRYINKDSTVGQEYIFLTKKSHWRTAESTTGSTSMSLEIFNKVKQQLRDCSIHDCLFYNVILKAGIRLFSPIPGKSTHVNYAYSSPLIDWQKYNSEIIL